MNDILSFLHLAPVGPTQPNPVVAGILEDQNFTYSVWNPPSYSSLINPAEGFLDWVGVDLGGPALSVSLIVYFYLIKFEKRVILVERVFILIVWFLGGAMAFRWSQRTR